VVGCENSIGLRGDGKICVDNSEKINLNANYVSSGNSLAFNLRTTPCFVGLGYIARSRTVFFTVNGKEVYQLALPECLLKKLKLYPSFSMGSLQDKISVNFG
jgi:hypothetical protein